MQFKSVIGQEEVKQHLIEMVQQNRLSHALLFLGKEGSGALPLALAFAQYMVCEKGSAMRDKGYGMRDDSSSLFSHEAITGNQQPVTGNHPSTSSGSDSCGICPSCSKALQLIHPDIHFTYPVIPKKAGDKPISTDYISEWREFIRQYPYGNVYDWLQFIGAENKQGNITAAECSDILRKLNLKSFEGGYKILLLWIPEYLEKEGNKLLKIIEEPPPNTLFILVAENESLILPTIVSRCQLIKIPPLETDEVEKALIERAGLSPEQARQAASISEGNYREAWQLVQHTEEDWQSLLRDWLNAILKTGPVAQVKWVEEIAKTGREKQKQFLRYFNHLLEQALRFQIIGSDNKHTDREIGGSDNERDFAMRLNRLTNIAQQQAIIQELDKAAYYIERNANAKMLFHALTIKLYHIIADKSLILTH